MFLLINANDYVIFFTFVLTMDKFKKKITMQDLAKELNTTTATVSRALNNSPEISEEMKAKVKALAKKHNFRPNSYASTLRKGKAKTIGVVVPFINRHFFSNIISNIERIVSASGYSVVILQTEEDTEKEKKSVELLVYQQVSGIIISLCKKTTDYKHIKRAINHGVKVVQVDNVIKEAGTSYIKSKDYLGSKATVLHLLEQGYRHIAFFNGSLTSMIYQDRLKGFIDAHIDAGYTYDEQLLVEETNSRDEGRKAVEHLIERGLKFDAIFSSGDYAALGAYLHLKEKGYDIPREVGIAGFANEQFTGLITPSLTSSNQRGKEIGAKAAQQIVLEIEDSEAEQLLDSVMPELIARKSTDKLNTNL